MKILKEGHFEDRMHAICSWCEAELEITSGDIGWTKVTESVWKGYYYDCPCCKRRNYLERNKLTTGVLKGLNGR